MNGFAPDDLVKFAVPLYGIIHSRGDCSSLARCRDEVVVVVGIHSSNRRPVRVSSESLEELFHGPQLVLLRVQKRLRLFDHFWKTLVVIRSRKSGVGRKFG